MKACVVGGTSSLPRETVEAMADVVVCALAEVGVTARRFWYQHAGGEYMAYEGLGVDDDDVLNKARIVAYETFGIEWEWRES